MTENTPEVIQTEEVVAKPYTFRKLGAPDMFVMFKIIKAIGINEFMACLQGDSLKQIVNTFVESQKKGADDQESQDNTDNQDNTDSLIMMGALAGVLEIANVIIGNLPKCEREIYQLLSQTSNLSVDEIKKPGNAVMFLEMVIDFIKKEEFKDFIEVVSKLFK